MKEKQFWIGVEVERLEGLVIAYETAPDDMPSLNAAVLQDVMLLQRQMLLGMDKLELWAKFKRAAAQNAEGEEQADPAAVGGAIEGMANAMEDPKNARYFARAVPASLRVLAEALKDPWGATKALVYGAVEGAQNILKFLGRTVLSTAKETATATEKHISKAVAASLLTSLSAAALQLSGALPIAWAWLKPLLDAVLKTHGAS